MTEDLELEIRKLVPEDGDVIVLKSQRVLPREARMNIASAVDGIIKRTGKKVDCLLLEDGMGIEILKTSRLEAAA